MKRVNEVVRRMRNSWEQERNDRERREREGERKKGTNLIRPAGGNEQKGKHNDKTI